MLSNIILIARALPPSCLAPPLSFFRNRMLKKLGDKGKVLYIIKWTRALSPLNAVSGGGEGAPPGPQTRRIAKVGAIRPESI